MTRPELARRVHEVSNLQGEFLLRSGAVSQEYFDKYRFEGDPAQTGYEAEARSFAVRF